MNSIRNTLRNIYYDEVHAYYIFKYLFFPMAVTIGIYTTYTADTNRSMLSNIGDGMVVTGMLCIMGVFWPYILPFVIAAGIAKYTKEALDS